MTPLDLFTVPAPTGLNPFLDGPRLDTLRRRVEALMADQKWRTLGEIRAACQGSEAGISARLREIRHHGATVDKRRRGEATRGIWEYRIHQEAR